MMSNMRCTLIIHIALKLRRNWRQEAKTLPMPLRMAGFTLIELSIVLVIISLVVGGVLVGQDLIRAANIRADFSTIEATSVAVNTFRLKYNQLPGDMNNPAQFGFDGATAGNRDRKIKGANYSGGSGRVWDASFAGAEWLFAQKQLAQAGLINLPTDWVSTGNYATMSAVIAAGRTFPEMKAYRGSGTDTTSGKVGIVFGWEQNQFVTGHHFRLGATSGNASMGFAGFHYQDAKAIDLKFDDGMPLSGRIKVAPLLPGHIDLDVYNVSTPGASIVISSNQWQNFHCVDANTSDYEARGGLNQRACALRVKADF